MEWLRDLFTEVSAGLIVDVIWKVATLIFAGGAFGFSIAANRNAKLAREDHLLQFSAVSDFRKLINVIGSHVIVRPKFYKTEAAEEAVSFALTQLEANNDFSLRLNETEFNVAWMDFKTDLRRLMNLTGEKGRQNVTSDIKGTRSVLVEYSKFIFEALMGSAPMTAERTSSLHSVLTDNNSVAVFGAHVRRKRKNLLASGAGTKSRDFAHSS